jgi:hypothetical protein
MKLFGSDEGKTLLQVKSHLVSKNGPGPGAGPVTSLDSRIEYLL